MFYLNLEIRLEFQGKARVHWTEQEDSESGTSHYSASEVYFYNVVPVFGRGTYQIKKLFGMFCSDK